MRGLTVPTFLALVLLCIFILQVVKLTVRPLGKLEHQQDKGMLMLSVI